MSKLLQVRIDDTLKAAADRVFSNIGLDTSTAVRMFLTAAIEARGLPFEAKSRNGAIELSDGYGSYVCGHGHIHDYSKKNPKSEEKVYTFDSFEDAIRSLDAD
jgi:addiction module RelB/DinJ family antitoxin